MNSMRRITILPCLVLFIAALGITSCHSDDAVTQVSFSELIKSPAKFSGHRIAISGTIATGDEMVVFEGETPPDIRAIWIEYAIMSADDLKKNGFDLLKEASARIPKTDRSILEYRRLLKVRVIGKFAHVDADPSRPAAGFGHLSAYRSQITIEKVLSAQPWE